MSPVFHERLARDIRDALEVAAGSTGNENFARLAARVDAALKPRRSLAPARKRKAAKLRSKKSETRDIREAVFERAMGVCECGCGAELTRLNPGELDHFFGRVRVPQSVETTWMLCRDCHRAKTQNSPHVFYWLERFVAHCDSHDADAIGHDRYRHAAELAEALAEKHRVKAVLQGNG